MTRTWKGLGWLLVLIGFLNAAPSPAGSGGSSDEQRKKPVTQDQLEDLNKTLKGLQETLGSLNLELRNLQTRESTRDLNLNRVMKDVNELKDDLAKMRQEMDNLKNRMTSVARISAYSGIPPTGTGRLRLANTYFRPVTIIVNGNSIYELAPGEVRYTDPMPAGPFSYEVLGVRPRRDLTLNQGETFNITVHP